MHTNKTHALCVQNTHTYHMHAMHNLKEAYNMTNTNPWYKHQHQYYGGRDNETDTLERGKEVDILSEAECGHKADHQGDASDINGCSNVFGIV